MGKRDPARHDPNSLQTFLSTAPAVRTPENDPYIQMMVSKIKENQRKSNVYKEAWHTYCQEHGKIKQFQGTKSKFQVQYDPSRHDASFLQQFLIKTPEPDGTGEPLMKRQKL